MIEKATGNLLEAEAEALVNTVNCVGFMGKGIALQFKQAFPENFRAYEQACQAGEVVPGKMLVFPTHSLVGPRFIINFPTKRHWRGNSRLEDIQIGLDALIKDVQHLGIRSIALPPLGCGNGGLNWAEVRPLIEGAFSKTPEVRVLLYAPSGAPDAKQMPVRTKVPKMTLARALFLQSMEHYLRSAYRLTLLEVQKLAYFLQEAGEPLKLKYEAGHYGPYSTNLNKVLEVIEGHFTRGYGDSQKPDQDLEILPGAAEQAAAFLQKHPESKSRIGQLCEVIEGFETPYGMELLSSVHWVARHAERPAITADAALAAIQAWSDRKRNMFKPLHIRIAWDRLGELGWLQK